MREPSPKGVTPTDSFDEPRRTEAATTLAPTAADAVTQLLRAWNEGDAAARDELVPLVERELHRLARAYMRRERQGHTLQATALVNEVFLRLAHGAKPRWQDRAHFVGIAARLMRQVLVDHARSRGYRKRGGGVMRVPLEHAPLITPEPELDVLAVDRALEAFAKIDPRKSQVVELRFFGGLSVEETADVLGVSAETVKRDWRIAKLWLSRELQSHASHRTRERPPRAARRTNTR